MVNPVILQKLDSLARCIERIENKRPASSAELKNNLDTQDIVMLNLERMVQLCVDIASVIIADKNLRPVPSTMAEAFEVLLQNKIIDQNLSLRMKNSVAFRNIAVHEYDKINWDIVFKIITVHLDDFREFAKAAQAL